MPPRAQNDALRGSLDPLVLETLSLARWRRFAIGLEAMLRAAEP